MSIVTSLLRFLLLLSVGQCKISSRYFPFGHAAILLVTPWYFSGVFSLAKLPFGHVAILLVTSWYFQTYFRQVPAPEAVWAR